MNQEDGYIRVKAYKTNRPWIRWLIPVHRVTIEMVFDVYAWTFMAQEIGLGFNEFDKIPNEDYMAWAIYGANASHASLRRKRGRGIEEIQELVRGILAEDRARILETINESRMYGQTIKEYAEAADAKKSKKVAPSDPES